MKQLLAIVLIAGTIGGCVSAQISAQDDAFSACQATKFSTATAAVQCMNAAENKGPASFDDLKRLRQAARLALAEKQDKGLISKAEAEFEFAKIYAQTSSEESSRASRYRYSSPITCQTIGTLTTCH